DALPIYILLDILVDLVEQLVQRDERGPFHVPVGLLALRLQVDAIGEALIEQLDRLSAGGLREIVLGGVQAARVGPRVRALARRRLGASARGSGTGSHVGASR